MSDIGIIRNYLVPWKGYDGRIRYYDTRWADVIHPDLVAYQVTHPGCRVFDLAEYGKVWYDEDARAHADGILNPDLAAFIERTMERTCYLPPGSVPNHEYRTYDWAELSEKVPCDIRDTGDGSNPSGVVVFRFNGREFYVDRDFLDHQMETNSLVFRNNETGTLWFECESSDLWEFALELVNEDIRNGSRNERPFDLMTCLFISRSESRPGSLLYGDMSVKKRVNRKSSPPKRLSAECSTLSQEEMDRIFAKRVRSETRPRSRWSKSDIIENCRISGVPEEALNALARIPLKDILDSFLIYAGTDLTGNESDPSKQRHTNFYRLNFERIENLAPKNRNWMIYPNEGILELRYDSPEERGSSRETSDRLALYGEDIGRLMPKIAIIGGTGIYNPDTFEEIEEVFPDTPYGKPSDPIMIGKINGVEVAFLYRHGKEHQHPPSSVPYRANMWALKELGCKYVISACAVGSLQEDFIPGDLVITDQFIDFTKKRDYTYFMDKTVHISIPDPFCPHLNAIFENAAKEMGIRYHMGGTYLCIEGPRFSTRAESSMFRHFADIIGMTVVPECQLARELGMCYCSLATITDYDMWKDEPVDINMVSKTMSECLDKVLRLLEIGLPKIKDSCKVCAQAAKDCGAL